MPDESLVNITYDNGPVDLDNPAAGTDLLLPEKRVRNDERLIVAERSRLLEYCIVASLILHIFAFAAIPRPSDVRPGPTTPDEPITPVRIVELPDSPENVEPPPEHASAISDRDHTAKKERLPKSIPSKHRTASLRNEASRHQATKPRKPQPSSESQLAKAERNKLNESLARIASTLKKEAMEKRDVNLQPSAKDVQTAFGSPDFHPDGEADEIVVDTNTRGYRFFSYLRHVKDKINGEWSYPQSAGSESVGGMLVVEFVIVKDGSLKSLAVLRSSGHAILDEAALCAIREGAPFHRFPPKIRAKRLRIRAEFNYIVNSFVRDAGDFIRKVLP